MITTLPRYTADVAPNEPERTPDGARHRLCAMCGQTFDMRALAQVYHHDSRPHVRTPRAER
jgi:hypothetical protein